MSRMRPNFPWFRLSPYGGGGAGDTAHSDCTIGTGPLTDCAVTTPKLADSAVDSTKLADSAVSSAGLQDSSVDSNKLQDSSVSTQAIQDSAIDSSKLQDCAVTYNAIQNVTAQRLLGREDALAGSPQEIALSAELRFDTNNDWLEVSDSGIINGLIADSAITTAKISDSQITTAKILDSNVTYAKIQAVTAQRLLARQDAVAGVVQEVPLSAEMRFDTDNDWLEIADCGVLTALLKDSAVSTVKLLDSAVDSDKLADSAVSSAGIQDGTIVATDFYDTNIVTYLVEIRATDTTLAVGDTLATLFIPAELNNYDLVRAEAAVKVVSTTGRPTIQLRDVTGTGDMLVNKITIDSGEKTSYTSDTASSIDTTNDTLVTGQEIAIDIDSAGTGTEDLYVILSVRKP